MGLNIKIDNKKKIVKVGLLSLAVVLIIAAGFAAYRNIKYFEGTIIVQAQQYLLNTAQSKGNDIETVILDVQSDLGFLASNPAFQYSVGTGTLPKQGQYDPLGLLYSHINKYADTLCQLNAEGIIQRKLPFKENETGADYSNKPGVKAVIENHTPCISSLFKSDIGSYGFSICNPVFENE